MDNKKFAQELYEAHKLMWMLQHGHTLNEVVQLSSDALIDAIHENPDEQLDCIGFDWEENGFNGEIWASFDEFMETEFQDAEYIHSLISSLPSDQQQELEEWYSAEISKDEDLYEGEGIELIENILEDMGIKCDIKDNYALIEFWTVTAGQDIPVEFNYDGSVEDLVKHFVEYAESYDVDEEVELYINGRGKKGVPETVRELTDDCQEAKNTLMEIARKFETALKNTVTYYGVSQFNHGAEHKWIFDSKTLSKHVVLDDLIDGDCIVCYFPIGGSNSSGTWFEKLSTDKEIKDFLLRKGDGPDLDDPELVDIAEYYCSVDVDDSWCSDKSCTGKIVEKLGITCEDTHDSRYEEVEKMLKALECIGYKNFDFEDPFYGKNRDMRYSELCDLYQQQIAEKLNIHQNYNIVENSYHSSSLSINSYFDDKEKRLSVLACFTIEAGDHIVMCAEKSPDMHGLKLVAEGFTPKLINAESCTFDSSHLEQWTYKDENIWEYESTLPRHEILDLTEKDKLKPEEITTAIVYYEHFNYGLFDSPADGHYSVPMVKQMIEDGFTKDRIAIIGKDYNAKEILKYPEVENFYKKTRDRLTKAGAVVKNNKGH